LEKYGNFVKEKGGEEKDGGEEIDVLLKKMGV